MSSESRKTRLHDEIDDNLRRVYNDALQEDIPQRFQDLLTRLRETELDGALRRPVSGEGGALLTDEQQEAPPSNLASAQGSKEAQ